MSAEEVIQQHIRLDAARSNINMWRNNVGAAETTDGRLIRYGLMNDSKKLNAQYKSADLIGIRPVMITAEMIGQVIGVFTSIEVKADNWTIRINDEHTKAQCRWRDLVTASGGYAGFAQSVHDARRIMRLG